MILLKKYFLTFAVSMATVMVGAQTEAPAFPGAEGHGRYVTGGREGTVYHVTNLKNSGTGSFRDAVSKANRIIVFDVAGVIPLSSDLSMKDNITVLGQTAPYPGITLRYYTIRPGANNIIRFVRFRRGEERNVNEGADATWQRNVTGIILDHCSFSWSIDEVASYYDNNNFTMQWCTIAESLVNAGHGKGAHGYGGIWGGKLASFHHNLIAHVANRSPRFNGARYDWTGYTSNKLYDQYQWKNAVQAENVDFRNCVVYNCSNGCYGGPGGGYVNMVNNYYKTGPAGKTSRVTNVSIANSTSSSDNKKYWNMTSRYYISGNRVNDNENYDWKDVKFDDGVVTYNGERYTQDPNHYYGDELEYTSINGVDCLPIKLANAVAPVGEITTHDAVTAFDKVTALSGASLYADEVDVRYFEEARTGTATYTGSVTKKKGLIDKVADAQGYTEETFPTGQHSSGYDTDGDGIPDVWELANGLDPENKADGMMKTVDTKGFYTNLEVFANSLVEDIMKAGMEGGESSYEEYFPACNKPVTGIGTVRTSAIVATEYYTLDGRRLAEQQHGVSLRVERLANGKSVTTKVIRSKR